MCEREGEVPPKDEKPRVVIRPSLFTSLHPRTKWDAHELLTELYRDDLDIALQVPDPGQFSVQNSLETIGIFIAGNVSGTVLTLLVTDLHDGMKRWLSKRFAKDDQATPAYITLYGPNGKPLKSVLGRSADHVVDMAPQPRNADSGHDIELERERLGSVSTTPTSRRFGRLHNLSVPEDFDEPLPDAELASWEGEESS